MLLTREGIAKALALTEEMAASELARRGVRPIDFGRGRGRGPRWYAEAVEQVVRAMHEEAQAKSKARKMKPRAPITPLASMSFQQIYELTKPKTLQ